MPGEFFFMGIAGLGVSLAGFAGLISALDPDSGSPLKKWRIRNIVASGLLITFVGFGTVAVQTLTDDVEMTVRIVSAAFALLLLRRFVREIRPGPAWPDARALLMARSIGLSLIILLFVNSFLASVGFLQLLLLYELSDPAMIFVFAVRDL